MRLPAAWFSLSNSFWRLLALERFGQNQAEKLVYEARISTRAEE
jgi:G:T/U-mismatch repair DNA glycosylase